MRLKLTREQRTLLFAGEPVKLTFPGDKPCPVPEGHVEVLSAHVKIEVTGTRRSKTGEHVLIYTLHNNRLGQRFLAVQDGQSHPEQYAYSGGSGVDNEAGEAVDEFTQRRITDRSRQAERARANEIILAVEDVRQAIRERAEQSPEFRKMAGRSLYRIGAELDRVVKNAKRHAA